MATGKVKWFNNIKIKIYGDNRITPDNKELDR
jgi:cold shock CspA family protein